MEDSFESISSVTDDPPNNFLLTGDHSEEGLFNCLAKRLSQGQCYTYAGSILISVNSQKFSESFSAKIKDSYNNNSFTEPHLYAVSYKAYERLKSSNESQVISLLGYSGAGKTFAAIHLLEDLVSKGGGESSLFSMVHSGIQIVHVMGSVISSENIESTVCGTVTSLHYDSRHKIVKASLKSKLLDYTLPYSLAGHTYHILHGLTLSSKTQLQSLGLSSHPKFKIFKNKNFTSAQIAASLQNLERFTKNLTILKFTRTETTEILEILSCVILLFEINFVGSSFVLAGDREYTEWTPRHRLSIQKVCKLLIISEEKFLELFQGLQNKILVENKLKELARGLYTVVFEWVVMKVNTKLNEYYNESVYKKGQVNKKLQKNDDFGELFISIVDFPGFHKNPTLGGFCSNLGFEYLNHFVSDKFINLLQALSVDKIDMKILNPPISKGVISILMSKESGLLQSLDLENFEKYWKEFRSTFKDSLCVSTASSTLTVKYTWGEVDYDIYSLRQEALKFIHPSEFNNFFTKCSNTLVKKLVNAAGCSISETFRRDVSLLLEPLASYNKHLVYFIKASAQVLDYNETIRLFRNTLVIPCLIWEWYGYQHWVSNTTLIQNFSNASNTQSQIHSYLNTHLAKFLHPDEYLVGLRFTLFKENAFQRIRENNFGKTTELSFCGQDSLSDISFDINPCKTVRARFNKVINFNEVPFDFKVYGDTLSIQGGIHDYLDNVVEINEMSFKRDSFSRRSYKLSKSTSNSSFKPSLQTVNSKKHFQKLKSSVNNYKLFNYDDNIDSIIKIQKVWKGYQARNYFKAFMLLTSNATRIQAIWKAYKQRKIYNFIKSKVLIIQKFCKRIHKKKIRAAIVIQKWYKAYKKKSARSNLEEISSMVSSIKEPFYPLLRTEKRSIIKSSRIPSPNETFHPVISKYSRALAKQREIKLGNTDMSVEKRLEAMELIKKNKIEELRKNKIEEERVSVRLVPNINKSVEFDKSFLERQEIKTQQIRMKRELEYVKKQSEEIDKLTFKPSLSKFRPNRSVEKSISDLHNWAKLKKAELTQAQKAKADQEARSVSPFKLSNRSKQILKQREKKNTETTKIINDYKETIVPYWPNNIT